jgi:hypothetical protein
MFDEVWPLTHELTSSRYRVAQAVDCPVWQQVKELVMLVAEAELGIDWPLINEAEAELGIDWPLINEAEAELGID